MNLINQDTIFYHLFPLGACGAPHENNFQSTPINRISEIRGWLDHIQELGCNAMLLGPIFESGSHGYDTANYYEVDRRLGTIQAMRELSEDIHARGMHLVLDGVFNHVGRNFWAFQDLQRHGRGSAYMDWFADLRFDQQSPYGDSFSYACWNGHFNLVKLNLANPEVREHLFGAIRLWKQEFNIDGLRLDAADALSFEFLKALRAFGEQLDPGLWLMGEVIHGDYRRWANAETLHATTNYELYKSLYSAHSAHNQHELAYSLNRQFGPGGIYRDIPTLYNFVDNHDVSRVASLLQNHAQLYPLTIALFGAPGVPSIYYGSEFMLEAVKGSSDWNLRPEFKPEEMGASQAAADLAGHIRRLASIRANTPALTRGGYAQQFVAADQLVFERTLGDHHALVAINSADLPARASFALPGKAGWVFRDLLNGDEIFRVEQNGQLSLALPPCWGRILVNTF